MTLIWLLSTLKKETELAWMNKGYIIKAVVHLKLSSLVFHVC